MSTLINNLYELTNNNLFIESTKTPYFLDIKLLKKENNFLKKGDLLELFYYFEKENLKKVYCFKMSGSKILEFEKVIKNFKIKKFRIDNYIFIEPFYNDYYKLKIKNNLIRFEPDYYYSNKNFNIKNLEYKIIESVSSGKEISFKDLIEN